MITDDLSDTPPEVKRYSRSVSQLKQLTRCGEQFRLSRLVRPRLPRTSAAWSVAGSAFHEVFQEWEASGRSFSPVDKFGEVYDRLIAEEQERQPDEQYWMKPPRTKTVEASIKNYRERFLTKDVPLYWKRCLEANWEILRLPDDSLALELEFEITLGDVVVKGAIDRVQWWPEHGYAAIEDLKTGSPDDEEDVRQLGLYRLAAEEVYDIDLKFGRYWYTKLDRPSSHWVDLSKYSREYLTDQYRILDRMISEKLLLPSPGKQCGMCDVRKWCSELGWEKA